MCMKQFDITDTYQAECVVSEGARVGEIFMSPEVLPVVRGLHLLLAILFGSRSSLMDLTSTGELIVLFGSMSFHQRQ